MPSLYELSAAELSNRYRARELSPTEVVAAVFDRIEHCEPKINAMYLLHREAAQQAAQASEQRWRAGTPLSAIDGVPITLKENLYTRGDPAPLGTRAVSMEPKAQDAPPSARVREAGAVILGKTTMPDFGMLSSGMSTIHGITRNPWRLDLNPAGSSSGAAAAAAAGYGPLHVGTDIGGSVRLPATHCGLFTIKPSLGRVPIDPPYIGRCAGPMTRSVRDAAMLLNVLAQPDPRDFMSLPPAEVDYTVALDGLDARGLRVGVLTDMRCGMAVDPVVVKTCESAAAALRDAGAEVETMASFMTPAMFDGMHAFFEARSFSEVQAMSDEARRGVLPFIIEWCTWRAGTFSGADVMAAYSQIQSMRIAAITATGKYDYVLSPVSPVTPYPADIESPTRDPHNALGHIAFTVAYNFSEQPASSVPWGTTDDGLPIGVQVIGRRFDDIGVLRVSRLLEQSRAPLPNWPRL